MDPTIYNKVDIAKVASPNLRLTGFSTANDLVTTSDTNIKNASYSNNYLYANLRDKNYLYYTNIVNSNANPNELLKHNFIMNNYTLINSNDTSGLLQFRYNIDANNMTTARKLNIFPLDSYDSDTTNGSFNQFNVMTNPYISVEIDKDTKNPVIKSNTTREGTYNEIKNAPLACDRVYPLYLATKDVELSKGNNKLDQNVLRCAYSKICGVPWSDLNCEKYDYK